MFNKNTMIKLYNIVRVALNISICLGAIGSIYYDIVYGKADTCSWIVWSITLASCIGILAFEAFSNTFLSYRCERCGHTHRFSLMTKVKGLAYHSSLTGSRYFKCLGCSKFTEHTPILDTNEIVEV